MKRSEILSFLIDRYERTKEGKRGEIPPRRVLARLTAENGKRRDLNYDYENIDEKEIFHRAVFDLSKKNLIFYDWQPRQTGNILKSLWLNTENLKEAYTELNRTPINLLQKKMTDQIEATLFELEPGWGRDYLLSVLKRLNERGLQKSILPVESKETEAFLKMLIYLSKNKEEELLENVFSVACFGDSKYFRQKMRAPLISVLKQTVCKDEDLKNSEVLSRIGIQTYPERFDLYGPFSVRGVDFSSFRGVISLSPFDIEELKISDRVTRVLTIENKANFIEAVHSKPDEKTLFINHGGQYSPKKKAFFLKLKQALPKGARWQHWGDIDFGGFSMLSRLREEITEDIEPLYMDLPTLNTHKTKHFSNSSYAERLEGLLQKENLEDCYETIRYMIENEIILEQESLLFQS